MNVLMLVMGMLMILSIMTYARLETFRSFFGLDIQFTQYMESHERKYANSRAELIYDDVHVSKKEGTSKAKIKGSSLLSWYLFLHEDKRKLDLNLYLANRELTKNLMIFLFKERPFFKKAIAERPDMLNELIDAITDADVKDLKIMNALDLANVDIKDPFLKNILFEMFSGYFPETEVEEKNSDGKDLDETQLLDIKETNSASTPDKVKLTDFITVRNETKIRVYLAQRPVLEAIYGNTEIVNAIIKRRKELYKELKDSDDDISTQVSATFEHEFLNVAPIQFQPLLEFSVTKSAPPK